jgi:hypothetical protein
MPNVDELAVLNYAPYDPQFADTDAEERASINDALDEVISTLTVAINELEAVKQNFTTRKYNMFILAIQEMIDEVEGVKE